MADENPVTKTDDDKSLDSAKMSTPNVTTDKKTSEMSTARSTSKPTLTNANKSPETPKPTSDATEEKPTMNKPTPTSATVVKVKPDEKAISSTKSPANGKPDDTPKENSKQEEKKPDAKPQQEAKNPDDDKAKPDEQAGGQNVSTKKEESEKKSKEADKDDKEKDPEKQEADDTVEQPKKKTWGKVLREVKLKSTVSRTFASLLTKKRRTSADTALAEIDPFLKRLTMNSGPGQEALEGNTCCDIFTKKFWKEGVVDPSKKCLYNWLGVVSLAVTYNLMVILLRSCFYEEQDGLFHIWVIFDYMCDILYLMDMAVQSRTAFLEQGLLVREKKKLALRYVKSWTFAVDIFCVLPTDFLYFALGSDATYVRLNRVFKGYRLRQFFQMMETRSSFPNLLRILILIFYILVLCHWNAGFYYVLSRQLGFGLDEWVYPNINERDYGTYTHKFCYSFYRSVLMLTTIGDEMVPAQIEEYMFVVFNSLVGVLIFATIFGNVGGVIANMNADREVFQAKIDAVKQYMKVRAVGKDLEDRVLNWFDYTWINKESVDDSSAVSCLPDKMKSEISIRVHMNTLRRVAIFQDCEPGLLAELVLKLKLQVFSPGDYVCKKGDIGKEMYIVKSGRLDVVSEDGKKVFVTLTDGAVFGEVSTLNIAGNKTGNRRTASVRSVGYSDLFCLNKHDLWDALQEYPEAKKMLWEKGKQILRKDNLLDEEAARRDEQKQQAFDQKLDNLLDMVNDVQADLTVLTEKLKGVIESHKPDT